VRPDIGRQLSRSLHGVSAVEIRVDLRRQLSRGLHCVAAAHAGIIWAILRIRSTAIVVLNIEGSPLQAVTVTAIRLWRGFGLAEGPIRRMARDMTPAAIRRLGELGGLLPDSSGNWIDLEALQVDFRVVEIACMTLVERTMGKPKEYDPANDSENPRLQFDVADPTVRQKALELIEAINAAQAAAARDGHGE
jgi:hypothetical protein